MTKPIPLICIGAAHWDIIARSDHAMDHGADVPGRVSRQMGGVALNIALALARLQQKVTILTAIGTDQPGNDLAACMRSSGIDCTHITRTNAPTDTYLAIESQGELYGAVADCVSLERAGMAIISAIASLQGTIIADSNLPESVLSALPGTTIYAPASPAKAARLRAALRSGGTLYANLQEAAAICDANFPTAAEAARAVVGWGANRATITDGPRLAAHFDGKNLFSSTPSNLLPTSATGAGDAFLAAHLVGTRNRLDPQYVLDQAVQAAANHIGRIIP